MKSKFLLFIILFLSISAYSQIANPVPDNRLYEAFGKEQVEFLLQNNPDMVTYYNFFLDNAFVLIQHPKEKTAGLPKMTLNNQKLVSEKPDISKGTKSINILKYSYTILPDESASYRLDDSGIAIVFFSAKEITEKYNKYKSF